MVSWYEIEAVARSYCEIEAEGRRSSMPSGILGGEEGGQEVEFEVER